MSRRAVARLVGLASWMVLLGLWSGAPAAAFEAAWQALRQGGAVALIRHARAPGVGDPPGFRLEDCATQRNLSGEGRDQARRLGARFRDERVEVAQVLSSRWCRALDTGRLAFGNGVEPTAALDSFFEDRSGRNAQTEAARKLILDWRGRPGVLVLVTHQVNITALTGSSVGEGEVLVVVPNETGLSLVGRIGS